MAPVTQTCRVPDLGTQALSWTTRDARQITVGPIGAPEYEPFAAFVRQLSATSRAHRFLVAVHELSAQAARRLVLVDQRSEVAWVAVACDPPCNIVGEVRYTMTAPGAAEFALAVADDWQRCGLGTFLFRRLLDHARSVGITFAWGHVRRGNNAILAVARRFCFDVALDPADPGLLMVGRHLRRASAHAYAAIHPAASERALDHRGVTP